MQHALGLVPKLGIFFAKTCAACWYQACGQTCGNRIASFPQMVGTVFNCEATPRTCHLTNMRIVNMLILGGYSKQRGIF
jgi:hypothetical protein